MSLRIHVLEHTAMHIPQMIRPQQFKRRSCIMGFSVFSSYCGVVADSNVAHVQQASLFIVNGQRSNVIFRNTRYERVTSACIAYTVRILKSK